MSNSRVRENYNSFMKRSGEFKMAEAGYEPVDLRKKAHIEETLVEELDDAIIKVAKMRKCQPPKCRSKARNITCNIVQYYSRVCVTTSDSNKEHLTSKSFKALLNVESSESTTSHGLKVLSKDITDLLAEREELMKALQQHRKSERISGYTSKHSKHRLPCLSSSHFYNSDFVVDEKFI